MSEKAQPEVIYAVEGPINPRSGAPTLYPALGEPQVVKDLRSQLEEARGRIAELNSVIEQKNWQIDNLVEFENVNGEKQSAAELIDAKDARIAELTDLKNEARFLVDRLREWEADGCDCDRGNREWMGHVSPPLARLEGILSKLEGKSNV